ncbi:MAG: hypothetical protein HUU20_04280, partial [Pirellulales bacterium]|nr:hypothetical protein [Pirellulales bacterium]
MTAYHPGRVTCLLGAMLMVAATATGTEDLTAAVHADWSSQESRKGRTTADPAAIRDALDRLARLTADLRQVAGAAALQEEIASLDRFRHRTSEVDKLDTPARTALYREIRFAVRSAAFKNPCLAGRPILFLKQRRFVAQMLHEYLGYYYNYGDLAGGGVCVLEEPGRSFRVRELTAGRLPRGAYTTLSLSFDAKTALFAFAEVRHVPRPHGRVSDWTKLPPAHEVIDELNYDSPQRSCFHIFAIGSDGENLRQLTHGSEDDFDPCPLPDGGLAFMSTRRGGFGRCHNIWEPLPAYTLHRMDGSGDNIERLSCHETNEWHPSVLNDGRIVYTRWDYV